MSIQSDSANAGRDNEVRFVPVKLRMFHVSNAGKLRVRLLWRKLAVLSDFSEGRSSSNLSEFVSTEISDTFMSEGCENVRRKRFDPNGKTI